MSPRDRRLLRFFILISSAPSSGLAGHAIAATHCVNPGGTGGCFASIQALVDAAKRADVIDVAAGTYLESVSIPARTPLTIRGAGPAATIIDGNGASAVLRITHMNPAPIVVENLAVRNGATGIVVGQKAKIHLRDCAISDNTSGGGLEVGSRSTARVVDCTVSGNTQTGGAGAGGVSAGDGTDVLISTSQIIGNDSTGPEAAGGIDSRGKLRVWLSTVSGNSSPGPGGGISANRLEVKYSTISGNSSGYQGGGIFIGALNGRVQILTSTISGNTAGDSGGGIYANSYHRVVLHHATIANNSATGTGGGIYARTSFAPKTTTFVASLIADNTASSEPDCAADRVVASAGNLVEDPTGCTIKGSVISADPLLGPLQDNGGLTETHVPGPGSPALGVVASKAACKTDQRLLSRPVPCDLGSYEVDPS